MLDERLVILPVGTATREDNVGRLAVGLQRLIHEHGVIVRVEAEQRKRQLLAQFRQHRAHQRLFAHDQRCALCPAGSNVGEHEGLDEAAARRWTAMRYKVGLDESRRRIIPICRSHSNLPKSTNSSNIRAFFARSDRR
ncbi:hypothetical protein ABH989_005492 [Bradyrhizobium ottawaense]